MPLFNVPQYIDVEDKIAGPLTGKQLLWMFGMGAALLILWNMLDQTTFLIVAFPVAALFVALAFYRPYNQPLITFIFSAASFIFHPKLYVWERTISKASKRQLSKNMKEEIKISEKKMFSATDVEALARTLDSEGAQRNERIMEIIKSKQKNS